MYNYIYIVVCCFVARALRDRASAPTSLASAFKMPVAAVCVIHLMTSFPYVWDILRCVFVSFNR